jgi:hypothetical protein
MTSRICIAAAVFALLTVTGAARAATIGGTVNCVGGCDINAVPLPAALPLFGSGLLALAGIAWLRGKVSG